MISAGDLNRTISFLSVGSSQDAFGQPTDTTTVLRTVRACRAALKATDFARGQVTSEVAEVKYLTRYYADIHSNMQIKEGTTVYSIIAIEELGLKEGLGIICKAAL